MDLNQYFKINSNDCFYNFFNLVVLFISYLTIKSTHNEVLLKKKITD